MIRMSTKLFLHNIAAISFELSKYLALGITTEAMCNRKVIDIIS